MDAAASELRRYVPNVVIARYVNDEKALTHEEMRSFNAAMGFFDISGFSALASSLRKKKVNAQMARQHSLASMPETRRGSVALEIPIEQQQPQQPMRSVTTAPEELTAKLNNALEDVIKVVVKYHGDVIKVGIKRYLILK